MSAAPWYVVENAAEIDTPALLVYRDRVEENIRRIVQMAGDVQRLWPHVKTHKMVEVVRMQRAHGIEQFKAATLTETELVATAGAQRVLLAHQPVGPKIARFASLVKQFPATRFGALVDDEGVIRALSAALAAQHVRAELVLDVDVGMGRSGIAPGPRAAELYRLMGQLPAVEPGGFHVYDGQVRQRDLPERIAAAEAAFAPAAHLAQQLRAEGLPVPRLLCGGTPSFPCHARHADRCVSPGTCVFWDASYEQKLPDLQFVNAALLLTRVISRPAENRVCFDLGYKAVSPDNPDPRAVLLEIPDARMVNHSEEHLVVETATADRYRVGDLVYAIPFHVCPSVALHRQAVIIDGGRATERWMVAARDRDGLRGE